MIICIKNEINHVKEEVKSYFIDISNSNIIATGIEHGFTSFLNYQKEIYQMRWRGYRIHPLKNLQQKQIWLGQQLIQKTSKHPICQIYTDNTTILSKYQPVFGQSFESVTCFSFEDSHEIFFSVALQEDEKDYRNYKYAIFRINNMNDANGFSNDNISTVGVVHHQNNNGVLLYIKDEEYLFPVIIASFYAFGTYRKTTDGNRMIVGPEHYSSSQEFLEIFDENFINDVINESQWNLEDVDGIVNNFSDIHEFYKQNNGPTVDNVKRKGVSKKHILLGCLFVILSVIGYVIYMQIKLFFLLS